jgi:hypothetical protein
MAYMTIRDINPKLILAEGNDGDLNYGAGKTVICNERSLACRLPIKRLAHRRLLEDNLSDPLMDRYHRELGSLCPVMDVKELGEARIEMLRKFLPDHLRVEIRDEELYIVENFDVIDAYYEKMFKFVVYHEHKRVKKHSTCALGYHYNCNEGNEDIARFHGMTSAKALRQVRFQNPDVPYYNDIEYFRGTDLNYAYGYEVSLFTKLWSELTRAMELRWDFDVHHDADLTLIYGFENNLRLNLLNHKVPKHKPVDTKVFGGQYTVREVFEGLLRKESDFNTRRWCFNVGDNNDEFLQRCKSQWRQSFINKLRFDGRGNQTKGRTRGIRVEEEYNFAQLDPMLCEQYYNWAVFGLSLQRSKPSIFNTVPDFVGDMPSDIDTRLDTWGKPRARMFVHHSNAIWRIMFQVPYFYWGTALRRYSMMMFIAEVLEDRDVARVVPFPVMRGLSPEMKLSIENTPYMSSAIQHAMYRLQFLLKNWDREHCTELELDNYCYAQMMPTEELPRRMAAVSAHRFWDGAYQGTASMVYSSMLDAGKSDLWMNAETYRPLQRVARAVSVQDEQLQLAVDAEPDYVRNRVLRL